MWKLLFFLKLWNLNSSAALGSYKLYLRKLHVVTSTIVKILFKKPKFTELSMNYTLNFQCFLALQNVFSVLVSKKLKIALPENDDNS